MKNPFLILFFSLLFVFSGVYAQNLKTANQYLNTKGEVYFKFKVNDVKTLKNIAQKISIDKFDYQTKEVFAYANKKGFDFFETQNLQYEILTHPGDLIKNPKMFSNYEKGTMAWDSYPTYTAYETMMYKFATDYPTLCRIEQIGTTVDGRKLLFAVISDNVATHEAEPRFMYSSSMHGDETTGYVTMLRLIEYLLMNYGSNSQVDNIVNNTEVWINPLENPDGTYASGNTTVSGATRGNANNVDLNRNYKNPLSVHPDGEVYQPEAIAMMNLLDTKHFVMSANSHGGAELANYPWDSWTSIEKTHADQDWWIYVCSEFRDIVHTNSATGYFTEMNNGITHGGDWYVALGTRQEYADYFAYCREFTLEISATKLVSASQLPTYWGYLYKSYLAYLEQVQYGFRGIVTDSLTGDPLYASVTINNHDIDNTHIYSELPYGDYYRPIKGGTYTVTFDADGYLPKTITVTLADKQTVIHNVQLAKALPKANFTATKTQFCTSPSTVTFVNTSTDASSYSWNFGDGGTSIDQNPTHIYTSYGKFTVSLTVQGTFGGSDAITKTNFIELNNTFACDYKMPNSGTQTLTACSGTLYDNGGATANYTDMTDVSSTITIPDAKSITVTVNQFGMEAGDLGYCNYDYLAFYDGATTSASLINGTEYCNTTGNPGTIVSTGNSITIRQYSDEGVNLSGFELSWTCDNTTSIENVNEIKFKIYPNPTHNSINIQTPAEYSEIEICDVTGKIIKTKSKTNSIETIDMSEFSKGIYLVKIKSGNNLLLKRFILD